MKIEEKIKAFREKSDTESLAVEIINELHNDNKVMLYALEVISEQKCSAKIKEFVKDILNKVRRDKKNKS